MCRDCGCSAPNLPTANSHHHHAHHHDLPNHQADHQQDHDHDHHQSSETSVLTLSQAERQTIQVHQNLLAKNDLQAEQNRQLFQSSGLLVVNLLSSPGSGKTRLLERTLTDLGNRVRMGVIVGDLQTENDARRLEGRNAPVASITTGTVCHLEAAMVAHAVESLPLANLQLLCIENVGNLVCPASFDLGEKLRMVILSTTEGEDKPLKYPLAFKTAQVVVINKIDLADAAGFDRELALDNIHKIAPQATVVEVSARTGEGMDGWYQYLESQLADCSAGL